MYRGSHSKFEYIYIYIICNLNFEKLKILNCLNLFGIINDCYLFIHLSWMMNLAERAICYGVLIVFSMKQPSSLIFRYTCRLLIGGIFLVHKWWCVHVRVITYLRSFMLGQLTITYFGSPCGSHITLTEMYNFKIH